MKTKRLLACVLISACLLTQSGIISSADYSANDSIVITAGEARSTYFSSAKAELTISGTTATCKSVATAKSSVTQIIGDMYLEKYVSGKWTAIDAWRLQKGGNTFTLSKTKSSLSSGSYRLKTEFTATASSGATETVTVYSTTKIITTSATG